MRIECLNILNDTVSTFVRRERKATNTEKLVTWPVLEPATSRFQPYSFLRLHLTHGIIYNFREKESYKKIPLPKRLISFNLPGSCTEWRYQFCPPRTLTQPPCLCHPICEIKNHAIYFLSQFSQVKLLITEKDILTWRHYEPFSSQTRWKLRKISR
jgi:hypothetical protein